MEAQRTFTFPISAIHLQSVLIFLCTVGQLYSAIAIPSISTSAFSSHATNATDLFVSTPASTPTDSPIVFVNHHRPDVGKTFASHLSRALISHGLRLGTIETASIHLAIFSKNYAKSSSSLNELRIMLKSGIPVIPLFYDVNPSDLECYEMYGPVLRMFRWTAVKNGALYDEDLRMLEEEKTFDSETCQESPRFDPKSVQEWRKALFEASGLCGFELATYNGDEGQLVHDVVKHLLSMKRVHKTPIHSYDVFLNHRGKDVKNTLASHLYYRLRNYGLRVFFDKEEMEKGNRINLVIENAIKGAPVHVAIFSAAYAESEWCMDELVLMLQSHSIIIPVFYHLKPTQIWWNSEDGTNGVYAEALHILKEEKAFDPETQQDKPRYESHTIEKWKEALMEVTGREGFKLETYDGDEGELVDMIVREVVKYTSKVKDDEYDVKLLDSFGLKLGVMSYNVITSFLLNMNCNTTTFFSY